MYEEYEAHTDHAVAIRKVELGGVDEVAHMFVVSLECDTCGEVIAEEVKDA